MSLSRRDFLGHSVAAVGVLAAGQLVSRAADDKPKLKSGADRVVLGKTGIKTSLLGMGTGSVGSRKASNQTRLGQEKFTKLVRHAYDKGITYFDAADMYGSHPFLRNALKELPREKLFLLTKTHAGNAEQVKADIERFCQELGVDYLDTVLMHCMTSKGWPKEKQAVMDGLSDAKSKGKVKAVGVSCHGMDPLRSAVDCDWVEIDLARINPVGGNAGHMDGSPKDVAACLQSMHDKGKGILGMKILAEGAIKAGKTDRVAEVRSRPELRGCVRDRV